MTTEQQIKALAELDGWKSREHISPIDNKTVIGLWYLKDTQCVSILPPYLTSYDAIIPVIQKQTNEVKADVWFRLGCVNWGWLDATPAQLCEALLRATGKWEE